VPAARRPARRKPAGLRRRASSERWWPALVVVVAVLLGVAWAARGEEPAPPPGPRCPVNTTSLELTLAQAANVEAIAAVARERGLPRRAVVIALATAQQESRLRNLDYGDRDSLGLFQQRPSQGWGTPQQVRDPEYAAGEFYERLVQVPGWRTGRLTDVAQAVQRSAYPELYQQWEPMARALTSALDDDGDLVLTCG
jgi:hypothetical protein